MPPPTAYGRLSLADEGRSATLGPMTPLAGTDAGLA